MLKEEQNKILTETATELVEWGKTAASFPLLFLPLPPFFFFFTLQSCHLPTTWSLINCTFVLTAMFYFVRLSIQVSVCVYEGQGNSCSTATR